MFWRMGAGCDRVGGIDTHAHPTPEPPMPQPEGRKPTNLSLDAALVSRARESRVNLSRAAEEGIRAALRARRAEDWRDENAEALDSSNRFAAQNPLPLAGFRRF
ncbi:hypothetical protein NBRC116596_28470 [Litorivita sp. NS0012-18]